MSNLPINPREFKKLCMFLYKDQEGKIRSLSAEKKVKFSVILREVVDLGFETLSDNHPKCNGVHYCTNCQNQLPNGKSPAPAAMEGMEEFVQQEVANGTPYEAVIRELIIGGLRYLAKENANNGSKYCQLCSKELSARKKHDVTMGSEVFTFCDTCYFSDKYKDMLRNFL